MKKIFSLILVAAMALAMVGCGSSKEALKFGMGVSANIDNASNADGDTDGEGQITSTVAAVLVNSEGKIVKCEIDAAQNKIAYTAEGKYIANDGFKTKYEQGFDYNMVAYSDATKEWFEQVDAFETVVIGKTIDEVKAMVVDGGSGNDEVVKAGCTIKIAEFVGAVEKAVANAASSNATEDASLQLGVITEQSGSDASEEAEGENTLDTTYAAAAIDKDGKVIVADVDTLSFSFTFDTKGQSTVDTSAALRTKAEMGTDYGMAAYGNDKNGDGVVKEWNEQAKAFVETSVGKTASEISGMMNGEGYGSDDVQKAGCTIHVTSFVEALTKAATIG